MRPFNTGDCLIEVTMWTFDFNLHLTYRVHRLFRWAMPNRSPIELFESVQNCYNGHPHLLPSQQFLLQMANH